VFPTPPSTGPRDPAVAQQPGFLFFGLLVLLQFTLAAALQLGNAPFGLLFSELFLFAGPAVLWCIGTNFRPRAFLRLRPAAPALVGLGVAIGFANYLFSGALQVLTKALLPPSLSRQIDLNQLFDLSTPELAMMLFAVALFAPLGEEIAFRGYLQTVFRARWSDAAAVAVSALLFAALHMEAVGFVARVELGALFGALALWSGSLLPAMAAHATNNLITTAIFLATRGTAEAQAEPPLGQTLAAGAVAAGATAALLVSFRCVADRRRAPEPASLALVEGEGHAFEPARAAGAARLWLLGAALAIALFAPFGWRAAAVNYIDLLHPVPGLEAKSQSEAPPERARLRSELREARQQARSGAISLGEYRERRAQLAAGAHGAADAAVGNSARGEGADAAGPVSDELPGRDAGEPGSGAPSP
jgi:membrane protease YdiL (CAAX protease family)